MRLRERDASATAHLSGGLDLRVGAAAQPLPSQFPIVQRFNETSASGCGRASAIILESSARARDVMRRQQSEALRQLRLDEPAATAFLAIEASALPVSAGLMLPPLPPKKHK
jgi:hypothetical protein